MVLESFTYGLGISITGEIICQILQFLRTLFLWRRIIFLVYPELEGLGTTMTCTAGVTSTFD
jgi:hypothetical protein